MLRTFLDAGVLIAAFRASGPLAAPAAATLNDANREFVTSEFVRLEVLPKPTYLKRASEVAFQDTFFAACVLSVPITVAMAQLAMQRAKMFGLSAVDALHVAAAEIAGADELVTSERPTSPLLRVDTVRVVSCRSARSSNLTHSTAPVSSQQMSLQSAWCGVTRASGARRFRDTIRAETTDVGNTPSRAPTATHGRACRPPA